TGYNGNYELAMTNNGLIVADRMATGTLRAINIIGVTITGSDITSESGYNKIIMSKGAIKNYYNNVLKSTMDANKFS
ncbi:hypothetical protein Q2440_26150, partial [Escherichia coli]|nr:hypothetical protein [Escherichia coli]